MPHGQGRTLKIRKGALVIVDWLDATAHEAGWNGPPENRGEPTRSTGIVVAVSSQALTLAADWGPSEKHKGDVNRAFTIPVGMVKRVREVRLAECRRIR